MYIICWMTHSNNRWRSMLFKILTMLISGQVMNLMHSSKHKLRVQVKINKAMRRISNLEIMLHVIRGRVWSQNKLTRKKLILEMFHLWICKSLAFKHQIWASSKALQNMELKISFITREAHFQSMVLSYLPMASEEEWKYLLLVDIRYSCKDHRDSEALRMLLAKSGPKCQ